MHFILKWILLLSLVWGSSLFTAIAQNGPGGVSNNLQLWLRSDAGVTGTTNVSAWTDQSGNGNDAIQGNGAEQPSLISNALNGNPAIFFDGMVSMMM